MNKKLLIGGAAVVVFALGYVIFPRKAFAIETATGTALIPSGNDKSRARFAAEALNASRYGGWFNSPDHSLDDVMGIWSIESNYKPDAVNTNDGGAGNHAYGIGQVLASTAGDFGVTNPDTMLMLSEGARVSMDYMKWSYEYLESRLNRAPTKTEWIGSYNAGVGGILAGRSPVDYLTKFWAARVVGLIF